MSDKVRLDAWLWSVRLFKTRSQATVACKGGHVRLNGNPVKPSQPVAIGDLVSIKEPGWLREFEVTALISKRVGAPIARECYVDKSLPRPEYLRNPIARRDPGTGRPTKKERRQIDALRGREIR